MTILLSYRRTYPELDSELLFNVSCDFLHLAKEMYALAVDQTINNFDRYDRCVTMDGGSALDAYNIRLTREHAYYKFILRLFFIIFLFHNYMNLLKRFKERF